MLVNITLYNVVIITTTTTLSFLLLLLFFLITSADRVCSPKRNTTIVKMASRVRCSLALAPPTKRANCISDSDSEVKKSEKERDFHSDCLVLFIIILICCYVILYHAMLTLPHNNTNSYESRLMKFNSYHYHYNCACLSCLLLRIFFCAGRLCR